jgi:hypothetical protein
VIVPAGRDARSASTARGTYTAGGVAAPTGAVVMRCGLPQRWCFPAGIRRVPWRRSPRGSTSLPLDAAAVPIELALNPFERQAVFALERAPAGGLGT